MHTTHIQLRVRTLQHKPTHVLKWTHNHWQNELQMPSLFCEFRAPHSSGLPQKPLFPFMHSAASLLFRILNLIGGRHARKSFPHACRIFIQMCERGQRSDWARGTSCAFHQLPVSERHLGSSEVERAWRQLLSRRGKCKPTRQTNDNYKRW